MVFVLLAQRVRKLKVLLLRITQSIEFVCIRYNHDGKDLHYNRARMNPGCETVTFPTFITNCQMQTSMMW